MKDELFKAYRQLQSERLLLREITEQDVDDVFEIYHFAIQMFSLLREDMEH